MSPPLKLLLVDDEAPARLRLHNLLDDIAAECATEVVAEAADGIEALERIGDTAIDAALVDIRMPRMDGLQLALHLTRRETPPAIIFITAFDQYAVTAFDLSAIDYLLKPVRSQRLLEALRKVKRGQPDVEALRSLTPGGRSHLRSTERGRVVLIPLEDVIYLRAEQKYVTAVTGRNQFLLEDTLAQLETEFGERFVRAHRNCLVARAAIAGYERQATQEGEEQQWQLILRNETQRIPVSRRQWPTVKTLFKD